MEPVDDSIIIVIGTVGYPTFSRCLRHAKEAKKYDSNIKKIDVVEGFYPTSAWLNEMRIRAKGYKWCLQIDEDMYIKKDAAEILLKLAKEKQAEGVKINNASSLLKDLFLESHIGSLKLWNTEVFEYCEFKDVSGSDRLFAKEASKLGYQNVAINLSLGMHDSAPNVDIAYFKYREYIYKIKKYNNLKSANKSVKFFRAKYQRGPSPITYAAYLGAVDGMKYNQNITKNYATNMKSKDLELLHKRIKKRFKNA